MDAYCVMIDIFVPTGLMFIFDGCTIEDDMVEAT